MKSFHVTNITIIRGREKPVKHKKQACRSSAGLQGITAVLPYTEADG